MKVAGYLNVLLNDLPWFVSLFFFEFFSTTATVALQCIKQHTLAADSHIDHSLFTLAYILTLSTFIMQSVRGIHLALSAGARVGACAPAATTVAGGARRAAGGGPFAAFKVKKSNWVEVRH